MRPQQFATTISAMLLAALAPPYTLAIDPPPMPRLAASVSGETTKVGIQLDNYMQMRGSRDHFTGTVLVAQNGKFLLARGYGHANAEWKTPNTLQTRFRLGSLTKQFTATAILQLRAKAGSACRIPYANTFSRALRLGSR